LNLKYFLTFGRRSCDWPRTHNLLLTTSHSASHNTSNKPLAMFACLFVFWVLVYFNRHCSSISGYKYVTKCSSGIFLCSLHVDPTSRIPRIKAGFQNVCHTVVAMVVRQLTTALQAAINLTNGTPAQGTLSTLTWHDSAHPDQPSLAVDRTRRVWWLPIKIKPPRRLHYIEHARSDAIGPHTTQQTHVASIVRR